MLRNSRVVCILKSPTGSVIVSVSTHGPLPAAPPLLAAQSRRRAVGHGGDRPFLSTGDNVRPAAAETQKHAFYRRLGRNHIITWRHVQPTSPGDGLPLRARWNRSPSEYHQNYDRNQVRVPVSRQRERPPAARYVSRQGASERRERDQGQRHSAAVLLFCRGEIFIYLSVSINSYIHNSIYVYVCIKVCMYVCIKVCMY